MKHVKVSTVLKVRAILCSQIKVKIILNNGIPDKECGYKKMTISTCQ